MRKCKKVTVDSDSLRVILENGLRYSGFLVDGEDIVQIEYKTKTIKAGDYYGEIGPGDETEVISSLVVLAATEQPEPRPEATEGEV